jgi:hypothetical protein
MTDAVKAAAAPPVQETIAEPATAPEPEQAPVAAGHIIGQAYDDCTAPEHKCRYGGCSAAGKCLSQPPPVTRSPTEGLPLGTAARRPAGIEKPAVAI